MAAKTSTPERILNCKITRDDENWLYYIDRRCNVMRMQRGVPRAKTELLLETAHQREKGFMYYLDAAGWLVRELDRSG